MAVTVRCPNPGCGQVYHVPEEKVGRATRCARCHTRFTAGPAAETMHVRAVRPAAPTHAADPPATAPPSGKLPPRVGRFEVRRALGAGAFGTVYLARDPQLDRDVALKVPHPAVTQDAKRTERFLREAKAAAGLRHPHIVPLYDAGEDGGLIYLAYAFIEGSTLAEAIEEERFEPRQAAEIVRGLAEALAYAHTSTPAVVHRDVKPSNVMIDKQNRPHLMDFGLAFRQDDSEKLTQEGALMGTAAYMAPEQAGGQRGAALATSDQYSLGVVLYEMLTGRTPFEGPAVSQIYQHMQAEPPPPSRFEPDTPLDLETICLKTLAKRPQDRYRSCGEMAEDLRRWLDGELIAARPVGPVERLGRWGRKNPAVAGLLLAVAAALALGTAVSTRFAIRAESNATEAEENAERAAANETQARAREEEARAEKERANREAAEAKQARDRAREQGRLARLQAYGTGMLLARIAWEKEETARVVDVLESQRPAPGEEDLRGFEWHYLWGGIAPRLSLEQPDAAESHSPVFSPDGKLLACFGAGQMLRVWDMRSGKEVARLPVTGVFLAFGPGGRLAWTSHDGTVHVRDLAARKELITLKDHWLYRVCFSPDGKRLASGGGFGGSVKLWDLETGKELGSLGSPENRCFGVGFSPDGHCLATSATAPLTLWDVGTGKPYLTLRGQGGSISRLVFSADGRRVASDVPTEASRPGGPLGPPGGRDMTSAIGVWDVATGEPVCTLSGHKGDLLTLAFRPDGRGLVSFGSDHVLRVWDLDAGKELRAIKGLTRGPQPGAALSPDGSLLVTAGAGNPARVWDVFARGPEEELPSDTSGLALFRPDGRGVALGGSSVVRLVDLTGRREPLLLRAEDNRAVLVPLAYSPDGSRVAAFVSSMAGDGPPAAGAGSVRAWDATTGKSVLNVKVKQQDMRCVAFDRGGTRAATGSWNDSVPPALPGDRPLARASSVKVWDLTTGRELLHIAGPGDPINALAFSPDGNRLAAAFGERLGATPRPGLVRVWELPGGREVYTLKAHGRAAGAIAFSPDGKLLASGSADGTVCLWDAASGKRARALVGHAEPVRGIAFSPDGSRLATASLVETLPTSEAVRLGEVKLWDTSTGQDLLTLPGHTTVVFAPDSTRLYAVSDGRIKVWSAPREGPE